MSNRDAKIPQREQEKKIWDFRRDTSREQKFLRKEKVKVSRIDPNVVLKNRVVGKKAQKISKGDEKCRK